MLFGYLTLATALIISLSAAVYSILGLTAIFAAAFWPIVIMGGSLEVGKIVTTLWLHKYWNKAELQYKVYLCSAVAVLMFLTSMGVFGFLSKAHSDQALVSGDVTSKLEIYDEKIKTAKENIESDRKQLKQMDEAVDQVMSRSSDEKGADKSNAIRKSQQRDRANLAKDIEANQKLISQLNDQAAPIRAEVRKVEADVGPIKYIAALIYGDNPDANLLEHAVRWVIILIVAVFDPLALTLLLAATKTFEWEHDINLFNLNKKREEEEESTFTASADDLEPVVPDPVELPSEELVEETEDSVGDEPVIEDRNTHIPVEDYYRAMENQDYYTDPYIDDSWPKHTLASTVTEEPEEEELVDPYGDTTPKFKLMTIDTTDRHQIREMDRVAKEVWLAENPGASVEEYTDQLSRGHIMQLPWETNEFRERVMAGTKLQADNQIEGTPGEVKGFGTQFPPLAKKGDMYLRVDQLPSVLYKFNGVNWIEVDKTMSDAYAHNRAYIDHLIAKISSGEYDPDLLSDSEREQIEIRLKELPPTP